MSESTRGAESTPNRLRTPLLYMTVVMLCTLILGVAMTIPGIVFVEDVWTSGIAIFPIVGVLLLVSSVGIRISLIDLYQTEVTVGLALYVLIEFLAGAALVLIGLVPTFFDPRQREWSMVGVLIFGLALLVDSALFYRRAFKKSRTPEAKPEPGN